LASPFGDGGDDGMVVQEENTERLHEVGNGGHHQGSTRYVMGGGVMFQGVSDGWGDGMVVQEEYSRTVSVASIINMSHCSFHENHRTPKIHSSMGVHEEIMDQFQLHSSLW
jgi:hypothetical protein